MPAPPDESPKAVLFDLDGTLYDQRPLRRAMIVELAKAPLRGPLRALRVARRLRAFRSLREELRDLGDTSPSLEREQYERPARQLGDEPAALEATIVEWMHQRPLPHVGRAGWPGMRGTLEAIGRAGLRLGVFSDYPPKGKLEALGIADLFDVAIAATDADVNAFKPHPRGFVVGAERLGVAPGEVVYVGDRVDVDALGAAAAGMRCLILAADGHAGASTETPGPGPGSGYTPVSTFGGIPHALGLD